MKPLLTLLKDLSKRKPSQSIVKLSKAGVSTVQDLLFIMPSDIQRIPKAANFNTIIPEQPFVGIGKIIKTDARPNFFRKGKGRSMLYTIRSHIKDLHSDQIVELIWFNSYKSLVDKIKNLEVLEFLGEVNLENRYQFINPKLGPFEESYLIKYPQINGVTSQKISEIVARIPSAIIEEISSPGDEYFKDLNLKQALKIIHGLETQIDPCNETIREEARKRLAYEEFLQEQVIILNRKKISKAKKGILLENLKPQFLQFSRALPYEMTQDQMNAMEQIIKDFESGVPMTRLLQGDVGCGKTTIAFGSAYLMEKNGFQTAIMAPTESLALQHSLKFTEQFPKLSSTLLLGSTSAKDKKLILEEIKNGKIQVVFGTHSLIQSSVHFYNLGMVIIDEQHKFGVEQRINLLNKGRSVHSLIMTATPIPRSLRLSQYGDLDLTVIRSFPNSKKKINTHIIGQEKFISFLNFLNSKIKSGEQAFLVVPAIMENEEFELLNLEKVFEKFKKIFPTFKISYLHGKMQSSDKEDVLVDFKDGKINILVATSVIEVGIDVPNANIIAIFNPERFGLSSLHQLRGRVGRGQSQGNCFLIVDQSLSEKAVRRLKVIESTTDGFVIAEEDLKIRGEGDLFGEEQSGNIITKKIADPILDIELLEKAAKDSISLFSKSTHDGQIFPFYFHSSAIENTI